jgi:L-aminopeptidase/D-esterase-like protein
LPKLESASDAVKASAAIVEAVATADLTPSQAAKLAKVVVDGFTRAVEAADLEMRLPMRLEAHEAQH